MLSSTLFYEMGLEWDENDEWRVKPDGEALTVVIEAFDIGAVRGYTKICPLLKEYWEEIGVKTILKTIDPGLWGARLGANELQVNLYALDPFDDLSFQILGPYIIGGGYAGTWYALPWNTWVLTEGASGEEPPEEYKRMRELWVEMQGPEDEEEIIELGKEILRIQAENLYLIGVVGSLKQPVVAKNNLRNFFEEGVWVPSVQCIAYSWPFQWFFNE